MHSRLKDEEITDLDKFVATHGSTLHELKLKTSIFKMLYSFTLYKEMYYRILAFRFT